MHDKGTIRKASGFKDDGGQFWNNQRGKYGVRYQCKTCGKITLGMYGTGDDPMMHHNFCEWMASKAMRPKP